MSIFESTGASIFCMNCIQLCNHFQSCVFLYFKYFFLLNSYIAHQPTRLSDLCNNTVSAKSIFLEAISSNVIFNLR